MKTTIFAAALLLSGSAYAAEDDLQPWSQATPENVREVTEDNGEPKCGRYHAIRDYRGVTCDEQIFEDIELDAQGGQSE